MGAGSVPGPVLTVASGPAPAPGPRPAPRLARLLAALATIALLSTLLSWGALALALRSLEAVWHDRVEALVYLHEVTAPLERVVPLVTGPTTSGTDSVSVLVEAARLESAGAWRQYLATTFTAEEARRVDSVTPTVERALEGAAALRDVLGAGDARAIEGMLEDRFLPDVRQASLALERLVDVQRTVTREQVQAARSRHALARVLLLAGGISSLALVIAALGATRGRARAHWGRPGAGGRGRPR